MALSRALMRGNGYHEWMTRPGPDESLVETMGRPSLVDTNTARSLPVINLCELTIAHQEALFEDIVPENRERLTNYLQNRHLGIGCILGVSYLSHASFLLRISHANLTYSILA